MQPFGSLPKAVLRESSSVGDLDIFYAIAEAWSHMVMHFLPETPVVLDIGCSCGKLARFLYLNPRLRYVGTDIFLPAIQWCREAFAPLAGGDGAFTAVVCASLFTRLLEPDCVHYLAEVSRLLGPRGRAIISIHTNPAKGQHFSGDEARIDIDQDYFVGLAEQAGLRLFEVLGRVYGQQVLVFETAAA